LAIIRKLQHSKLQKLQVNTMKRTTKKKQKQKQNKKVALLIFWCSALAYNYLTRIMK